MNKKDRAKLKGWVSLKGKEKISISDVLSIQPMCFWVFLVADVIIAVAILFYFGAYSLPFGVILGGTASTLGHLIRIKRNLAKDLRYINWDMVNEALNEQNT
jgi:hypothetical protein